MSNPGSLKQTADHEPSKSALFKRGWLGHMVLGKVFNWCLTFTYVEVPF